MPESDVTQYLRTLSRARARTAVEDWNEAAPLWEQVVARNPVEGSFWAHLADARYHLQGYGQATAAYKRAMDLGDGYPAEATYHIACCYALLGDPEQALTWLRQAFDMGYRDLKHAQTDSDLQSLHGDAHFREIVALIDTRAMTRDDGWWYDLRLLAREVQRKSHHLFRPVSRDAFDAAVRELADAIPTLTDLQIAVEMMKLLRTLGDGHAGIYGSDDHQDFLQAVPVQFYLFEEGLYVIAADPKYEELLGTQVLRFGDRTVAEVMRALDPLLCRDNDHWPKQVAPYRMRELPLLHALGLIPEPRQVQLTILDHEGKTRTATLVTDTGQPSTKLWETLSCPAGWRYFPQTLPTPLPHYLKNLDVNYWFEYLPEDRVVYFQFNRVRDDQEESLAAFCDRLFGFTDDHEVQKLVIDMRWNDGGNTFLELPLVHGLIGCRKINRRGKLFVIIGRRTFSAAQNGTSLIERHTDAMFVGEPTGASPNFVGETIPFQLPYSKLWANVSDLYWQSSWPMDYRTWIAPHIYTPPTFAAYRENRDPAMEAILACREHLPGW